MVRYIFASHYRMADGLKETVEFLTSVKENLYTISAYVTEDYNIEEEIKKIFDGFQKDDKVVVMTDVLSGSVNQKYLTMMPLPHHIKMPLFETKPMLLQL